jgi:hypothetical protein
MVDMAKVEKLRKFGQALQNFGALQSGDPQRIALVQKQVEEANEKKKQQQQYTSLYNYFLNKTNDPVRADELAKLAQMPGGSTLASSEVKPRSKSDFVVDILNKINKDPNYKLTVTDQKILDTISDTDPLEIYKRKILGELDFNIEEESEPKTKPENFNGTSDQWKKFKASNPSYTDKELISAWNNKK